MPELRRKFGPRGVMPETARRSLSGQAAAASHGCDILCVRPAASTILARQARPASPRRLAPSPLIPKPSEEIILHT